MRCFVEAAGLWASSWAYRYKTKNETGFSFAVLYEAFVCPETDKWNIHLLLKLEGG